MITELEAIQKMYPNDDRHFENVAILSFNQFLSYLGIGPSLQQLHLLKLQQLAIDAVTKNSEFKKIMKDSRLALRALEALKSGRVGQTHTLGNQNNS